MELGQHPWIRVNEGELIVGEFIEFIVSGNSVRVIMIMTSISRIGMWRSGCQWPPTLRLRIWLARGPGRRRAASENRNCIGIGTALWSFALSASSLG